LLIFCAYTMLPSRLLLSLLQCITTRFCSHAKQLSGWLFYFSLIAVIFCAAVCHNDVEWVLHHTTTTASTLATTPNSGSLFFVATSILCCMLLLCCTAVATMPPPLLPPLPPLPSPVDCYLFFFCSHFHLTLLLQWCCMAVLPPCHQCGWLFFAATHFALHAATVMLHGSCHHATTTIAPFATTTHLWLFFQTLSFCTACCHNDVAWQCCHHTTSATASFATTTTSSWLFFCSHFHFVLLAAVMMLHGSCHSATIAAATFVITATCSTLFLQPLPFCAASCNHHATTATATSGCLFFQPLPFCTAHCCNNVAWQLPPPLLSPLLPPPPLVDFLQPLPFCTACCHNDVTWQFATMPPLLQLPLPQPWVPRCAQLKKPVLCWNIMWVQSDIWIWNKKSWGYHYLQTLGKGSNLLLIPWFVSKAQGWGNNNGPASTIDLLTG